MYCIQQTKKKKKHMVNNLFVTTDNKTFALNTVGINTVRCLCMLIHSLTGIDVPNQRLTYGTKPLRLDANLCDYNIHNNATIHLFTPLLGGIFGIGRIFKNLFGRGGNKHQNSPHQHQGATGGNATATNTVTVSVVNSPTFNNNNFNWNWNYNYNQLLNESGLPFTGAFSEKLIKNFLREVLLQIALGNRCSIWVEIQFDKVNDYVHCFYQVDLSEVKKRMIDAANYGFALKTTKGRYLSCPTVPSAMNLYPMLTQATQPGRSELFKVKGQGIKSTYTNAFISVNPDVGVPVGTVNHCCEWEKVTLHVVMEGGRYVALTRFRPEGDRHVAAKNNSSQVVCTSGICHNVDGSWELFKLAAPKI